MRLVHRRACGIVTHIDPPHPPTFLFLCLPPARWPHFICRFIWLGTAWASLQSDPTASLGPGPLFQSPQGPTPCLPYLLQFIGSAMAAICEACRKADAVFPFVKSRFWKAVTTLTAGAQRAREWKGSDAARAHTHARTKPHAYAATSACR